MKTILDLLREFGTLQEAKAKKGKLSPKSEERWAELKNFYDRLMADNGISRGVTRSYAVSEIREHLRRRKHLRVPMAMEIIFEHEGQFLSGRVTNLSCGGVFLMSDTVLDAESKLTLYLANVGRGSDAMMTVEAEVVWSSNGCGNGMGIRFVNIAEDVQRQLDSFVLETLEKHLCGLSPGMLDPDFLEREKIKL